MTYKGNFEVLMKVEIVKPVSKSCTKGALVSAYRISIPLRPSTAGIIRTQVLIEGWYYYQNFINLDIETRKL